MCREAAGAPGSELREAAGLEEEMGQQSSSYDGSTTGFSLTRAAKAAWCNSPLGQLSSLLFFLPYVVIKGEAFN